MGDQVVKFWLRAEPVISQGAPMADNKPVPTFDRHQPSKKPREPMTREDAESAVGDMGKGSHEETQGGR
jgi:hypothetical protein